jgi:opine dehydrogenase
MSISHSDSLNFSPLAEDFSAYPAAKAAGLGPISFAPATVVTPQAGHIAIVGAGNAARSLACVLSGRGFYPHFLVRSPEKVKALAERKSISCTGKVEGVFPIVEATAEPASMLDKCATIFVATTTGCYGEVARRLAPHLREHHEIILFSSKFGGVCEFKTALGHRKEYPAIVETDSLFASRIQEDESVWIRGVKQWTLYSSWNKTQTARNAATMRRFFPGLQEADNVVQRGLTDFGAFAHPITMLTNMHNVARNTGFLFYYEGFTERTLVIMEQLEEEFRGIARAYETDIIPMKELLNRYYGCDTSGNLLQAMRTVPNYSFSKAPDTLNHRFIEEDVSCSLVPMQQLAAKARVKTPIIDSIINMSTVLLGRDFAGEGRTLAKLGWTGMSHAEILRTIYE